MGIKIGSMNSDGNTALLKTEYGETIEATNIASDAGETIANYDRGDRWAAIIVTDYGDGYIQYDEFGEGTNFGVTCQNEYVVRRTDNAGSLKWVETEEQSD